MEISKIYVLIICCIALSAIVILDDVSKIKRYNNSMTASGIIVDALGLETIGYFRGINQFSYGKYVVQFSTPQGQFTRPALFREKGLQVGTEVVVHYVDYGNRIEVVNDVAARRLERESRNRYYVGGYWNRYWLLVWKELFGV